ncbi:MAG TPA: TlpA disulfide reductase family protein [Chitinophagaceae bacterium]|jgi:thiol-disulfide isomerase/thioredoxin
MKAAFLVALFFFTLIGNGQSIRAIKITDLTKTIKQSKTPLIVNFWASFCVPCLQEIPYFQELTRKYQPRGVNLLLVSLDLKNAYPDTIANCVKKHDITAPVVWLNEDNADSFCPKIDSSWLGNMPSSLFVNNATGYYKFFDEQLSRDKLEKQIQVMLAARKPD